MNTAKPCLPASFFALTLLTACIAACTKPETDQSTSATTPGAADGQAANGSVKRLVLSGFLDTPDVGDQACFVSVAAGEVLGSAEIYRTFEALSADGDDEALREFVINAYDFAFDATHGIAANAEINGWELGMGQAGFAHMGQTVLAEIDEAPEDGYEFTISLDDLLPRQSYCLRAADGEHYAKFTIVELDREANQLTLDVVYQANGTRQFE